MDWWFLNGFKILKFILKSTIHRFTRYLKEIDGYTAKSSINQLLAQITTENFDSRSLSPLFQKLGKLEHEKQKVLLEIDSILQKEKA
ncbi:hypothetical protein BKK49_01305 [Rodentibacter rarus]|uniref:Uncharacterized protein n=1 Tax=Rodentibacter rarus TaxID=1908260 RepID=A0A1V3IML9_9PAST|nr:hypothetical protein [Rodentibacter rarus]OOF42932.1 hypothetical protein BKK50_05720 [Rodentibacter rarus]OOF42991.1 hypothetical protein BKK49_01305 [Rodentibacter rarus]